MNALAAINPFLAARLKRVATCLRPQKERQPEPESSVYAKLPRAPRNASPVPRLTSLYHHAEAGPYGDRGYPGNCGGNLIKDLLLYFKPGLVLDPMSGSGTCLDVCQELGIPCMAWDIPLTYHTKRLAFTAGLRQHGTDIIRFSHGASSGRKVYRSSFIPGLHDVCMIFEKTN